MENESVITTISRVDNSKIDSRINDNQKERTETAIEYVKIS